MNAFVTPKSETANGADTMYLKQNLLSLQQAGVDVLEEDGIYQDVDMEAYKVEDMKAHIVTTSDIDNYFNLQITTKLYFGSN